uniref:Uncharacterized protein n=1 Tax=Rhizophora mucronata TaxID=61149 RepID=A0A2P2NWE6_RHIMU
MLIKYMRWPYQLITTLVIELSTDILATLKKSLER